MCFRIFKIKKKKKKGTNLLPLLLPSFVLTVSPTPSFCARVCCVYPMLSRSFVPRGPSIWQLATQPLVTIVVDNLPKKTKNKQGNSHYDIIIHDRARLPTSLPKPIRPSCQFTTRARHVIFSLLHHHMATCQNSQSGRHFREFEPITS